MRSTLWALVALSFVACSGPTGGSDNSPDKGNPIDTADTEGPDPTDPTKAYVNYTAMADGQVETCQVNRRELDETSFGLVGRSGKNLPVPAGAAVYALGDPELLTLGKQPVHADSDFGRWLFQEELSPEIGGEVLGGTVDLIPAPEYLCSYTTCEYQDGNGNVPGNCTGSAHFDDPQGIFMDPEGYLQGDQNNSFSGAGNDNDVWRKVGNQLEYTPGDPNNTVTNTVVRGDLSFSYTLINDVLEIALTVNCALE